MKDRDGAPPPRRSPDRPGAGAPHPARPAKPYYRRFLPHLQPAERTLFVTFTTRERWVIPETLRAIVLAHCLHDHQTKLWAHGVVVMPDHVHMVFTPLSDAEGGPYGLAEILGAVKGASAQSLNKALGRRGPVWQREYWDRVVRQGESIQQVVEYVCQNPVRAGFAGPQGEYPWLWREWIEGQR